MPEKMFEKILADQEKFDSKQASSETRKEILESGEIILNYILAEASHEEAENIQKGYDEYRKAEQEIYDEKGEEMTIDDIKERIPDNLWIKIMYSEVPPVDIKDMKLPEFDAIWERYEKDKGEEELRKAKEKKRIS